MKRLLAVVLLSGCVGFLGCAAAVPAPAPVVPATECAVLAPVATHPLVSQWKSENRKFAFTRTIGAEAIVLATPSLSIEWLERTAHCRIRHPDVGLPDATVRVLSIDGGYAIQLTSTDPATARTITERASRL